MKKRGFSASVWADQPYLLAWIKLKVKLIENRGAAGISKRYIFKLYYRLVFFHSIIPIKKIAHSIIQKATMSLGVSENVPRL